MLAKQTNKTKEETLCFLNEATPCGVENASLGTAVLKC